MGTLILTKLFIGLLARKMILSLLYIIVTSARVGIVGANTNEMI